MNISTTDEEISHAAMRPPAAHRRPSGARTAGGAAPRVPRVQPRPGPVSAELGALVSIAPGPAPVVSLYLDLDPASFAVPSARESQVQAVIDAARHDAREYWDEMVHDSRQALLVDLETARAYLISELDPAGASGVALFASGPRGLFQVFRLDERVPSQGRCGPLPHLRPLFELRRPDDWAILAIDRREARIVVSRRGLPPKQLVQLTSEERGHRESSGASQARVERAVDHDTRQHVRRAVRRLVELHQRAPIGVLVLACGEEIHPLVEGDLPVAMRPLVAGRVPYDPEAPQDALVHSAGPLLLEREMGRERDQLDRLQMEVGRGGGAVGIEAVLDALNRSAVEVLVLETGVEVLGFACPACGCLDLFPGACRVCGHDLERHQDLVEHMLRRAVHQSAEVRFLRSGPPHPGVPAHVAAVLRPPAT